MAAQENLGWSYRGNLLEGQTPIQSLNCCQNSEIRFGGWIWEVSQDSTDLQLQLNGDLNHKGEWFLWVLRLTRHCEMCYLFLSSCRGGCIFTINHLLSHIPTFCKTNNWVKKNKSTNHINLTQPLKQYEHISSFIYIPFQMLTFFAITFDRVGICSH